MVCTRPDISYVVSKLSRFVEAPSSQHWEAIKRVIRYLNTTQKEGLRYSGSNSTLIGYSDADYAACLDTRSTTGFIFMFGSCAISWKSQIQKSTSLSTAESEYMAACAATKDAVWLRRILAEFGLEQVAPTALMIDNQSAIKLSNNPEFHQRTKHIDIQYHFIREKVEDGTIVTVYVPTQEQYADILTKALARGQFKLLKRRIGVEIEWEC